MLIEFYNLLLYELSSFFNFILFYLNYKKPIINMDYILNKLKMILIGQDKLKYNFDKNTNTNTNTNTNKTSNLNNFNIINNNTIVDNTIIDNNKFTKPASYKNLNSSSSYTN